ncbi:hypothetical protein FJZ19_01245 [Candidatus Pacearchaeota archaeon]|nr:hypothetical protein [Candidatus Pacearchaeota archaeon]
MERIKAAREHVLDCAECMISLDEFLLKIAKPELFSGAHKQVLEYLAKHDGKKKLYLIGLPWPHHESSPKYGRLVLGIPASLTLECGLWYFNRMKEEIEKYQQMRISDFKIKSKHDGTRKPCYQADAQRNSGKGKISIRARRMAEDVLYKPIIRL